uniref:Uncharacterized protein n=1 Tax=Rhizophora mucronata TaxID=61149 RepID=A0A2P2N442_RHIMU
MKCFFGDGLDCFWFCALDSIISSLICEFYILSNSCLGAEKIKKNFWE